MPSWSNTNGIYNLGGIRSKMNAQFYKEICLCLSFWYELLRCRFGVNKTLLKHQNDDTGRHLPLTR